RVLARLRTRHRVAQRREVSQVLSRPHAVTCRPRGWRGPAPPGPLGRAPPSTPLSKADLPREMLLKGRDPPVAKQTPCHADARRAALAWNLELELMRSRRLTVQRPVAPRGSCGATVAAVLL